MNIPDYAVGNTGKHDRNFGLAFPKKSIAGVTFPYINANIFVTMARATINQISIGASL